ncbi:MAG TPA: TIGR04255 family protein [Gemmatimonadaceae bacterium]|nr:TIGR04255 family protein [Gemmatimonadaceae bacterium]
MAGSPAPTPSNPATHPRQRYARPPVVEAVVDIHADVPENLSLETLAQIYSDEDQRYPVRESLIGHSITVDASSGLAVKTGQEVVGHRYMNASRDVIVQVRRNGFSYSKLPPYRSWEEDVLPEAQRLWSRYAEITRPVAIKRLAVRYINRIDLPPRGAFEQYFTVYPNQPGSMPEPLINFVMRLEIPQTAFHGGMLILTQGRLLSEQKDVFPVLLDLDLSQIVQMPADGAKLWQAIERLHARMNEVFEGCITPTARAIFQPC